MEIDDTDLFHCVENDTIANVLIQIKHDVIRRYGFQARYKYTQEEMHAGGNHRALLQMFHLHVRFSATLESIAFIFQIIHANPKVCVLTNAFTTPLRFPFHPVPLQLYTFCDNFVQNLVFRIYGDKENLNPGNR
jgi:hypothetical protein